MSPHPFPDATLHHVGYLVADIGGAADHFRTAFGYRIESRVIEDPLQTAKVQFLRLPTDRCWLELISPLGQSSRLDGALRRGTTLHHLCYEVASLERYGETLRQNGFSLLREALPAVAFGGRRICWFSTEDLLLVELVEAGDPPFSAAHL